jgi:hypothetical protein
MRRPRVPYVYAQVGWFLAACAILGGCIGLLIAGFKGA